MQAFGKMVSILMAVMICVIGPAKLTLQRQEAKIELAVMALGESYLEQWKQRGCITKSSYSKIKQELANLGGWQLELEYGRRVLEPALEDGKSVDGYLLVPQKELEERLDQEGFVPLKRGDTLEIVIRSMRKEEDVIRYGGIVTGEFNENSLVNR